MVKKVPAYPSFNVLLAGLLFSYVAAFFLQLGVRVEALGAIRFEFLVAGLLMGWAIVYRDGSDYPATGIAGPLTFLLCCVVVQVPLSVDVQLSWVTFVDRVLKFAAMAFVISRFVNSPRMLAVLLSAFLLSCFKMGQEGLVGNISGGLVWQNQGVMRLHGSTPMYAHPNSFAGMAMGTLPFAYYLFPVVNRYIKAFLLVLLILSLHIVVFTASRTAYVAVIGMMFYVFWTTEHKKKIGAGIAILATSALLLLPDQYLHRFESIFTMQEAEGRSSETRLEIIEDALQVVVRHPLGVGVGAFPVVREQYFGRSQDTHNLYLEVATNIGIHGLLAFLLVVGSVIRSLRRTARSLNEQKRRLSGIGIADNTPDWRKVDQHCRNLDIFAAVCNATIAYIVVRLLLGLFGMDFYEIYWWFAIGISVAMAKLAHHASKITVEYCRNQCERSPDG